ncbi:cupin domain-containing protein [Muricoccus radiodurans]|uniref:cupin domain-containing protein n=1 Tax=Muricoccus radiodurans TaxID=2231721 RepID=UPI003CE6BE69
MASGPPTSALRRSNPPAPAAEIPASAGERPDDDATLGAQLRALRKARGLSLQELAASASLSVGLISQVERGLSSPSVKTLRALADALGVTVGWLFHHGAVPPAEEHGLVLRRANRRRMTLNDGAVVKELLTPRLDSQLEMLIVNVTPGGSSGLEPYTHAGEECGLVLEGELDLWVEGRRFRLSEGDAFGFVSGRPHRFENPGTRPARVLWVITPPTF